MFARCFVIAAVSVLCAPVVMAQTNGQLLERAIFAEETAGDQAAAIRIYERLVSAPAVPSEIAARARTRLAGIRREQAQRAALAEQRSGRQTGLPGQVDPPPPPPPGSGRTGGRSGRSGIPGVPSYADMYDSSRPVAVVGRVTEISWTDPHVVIFASTDAGEAWGFVFGPPANLERGGFTKDALKIGEQVRLEGTLARGVGICPAPLPNGCARFANGAQHANARQILKVDAAGHLVRPGGPPVPGTGGRGGRGGVQ